MSKPSRIDPAELKELLLQGKAVKQIAERFGVTAGAVSQAKKKLGVVVGRVVQLESAGRFVNEHLDTVAQLRKINTDAHELLDSCMKWLRGDDEALQILETQVRKVRVGRGEATQEVTEYKFRDPREIALRAMAEIRSQLALQNQTLAMLAEMSAVYEFQQELVELLKEIAPEARDEFLRRINEKQIIRRAVRVTQ
jgi:transcriptional regulator with XRE-family HTH domain